MRRISWLLLAVYLVGIYPSYLHFKHCPSHKGYKGVYPEVAAAIWPFTVPLFHWIEWRKDNHGMD